MKKNTCLSVLLIFLLVLTSCTSSSVVENSDIILDSSQEISEPSVIENTTLNIGTEIEDYNFLPYSPVSPMLLQDNLFLLYKDGEMIETGWNVIENPNIAPEYPERHRFIVSFSDGNLIYNYFTSFSEAKGGYQNMNTNEQKIWSTVTHHVVRISEEESACVSVGKDIHIELYDNYTGGKSDTQLNFDFTDVSLEDKMQGILTYFPFAIDYNVEKQQYVVLYGKDNGRENPIINDNSGVLIFDSNGSLEDRFDIIGLHSARYAKSFYKDISNIVWIGDYVYFLFGHGTHQSKEVVNLVSKEMQDISEDETDIVNLIYTEMRPIPERTFNIYQTSINIIITDLNDNELYKIDSNMEFSFYSENSDGSYNIVFQNAN